MQITWETPSVYCDTYQQSLVLDATCSYMRRQICRPPRYGHQSDRGGDHRKEGSGLPLLSILKDAHANSTYQHRNSETGTKACALLARHMSSSLQ